MAAENGATNGNEDADDRFMDKGFRRKLRADYRQLANNIEEKSEEAVNPESKLLQEYINDAEKLFSTVRHPREAISDSNVLVALAKKGREQAQLLKADIVSFDNSTFIEKIVTYVNGRGGLVKKEDDDNITPLSKTCWKKLGKKACQLFRKVPTIDFLLGPLVIEVQQVVKPVRRQAQRRMPEGETVKLKQISTVEQQEEATTKEVERIFTILKEKTKGGKKRICLFLFIINPESFGQTVENLFHLSFLIKDGRVTVELDEDELPTLNLHAAVSEQDQSDMVTRKQVVLPLTMVEWQKLKEAYGITEGMIPTRKKLF